MKKITTLLTICTVLSGSAFGQDSSNMRDKKAPCPQSEGFAWATAVAALAVLGAVVGLTVSQAD